MSKDHYVVLGVSKEADLKKIKKAYGSFAKKYHPDARGSEKDRERFIEIKEAYEILADEAARRKYDEELEQQGSGLRISRVPDIIKGRTSIFDEMDSMFSYVDDFFSGFLPGFFEKRGMSRGKDLYFEAILSPSEASKGGLFPVSVPVIEPCPRCHKTGMSENFFCPVCHGYGRVQSEREFSLSIPPHVNHGTRIRVSMEDIGLKDSYLNVEVLIDASLEEEDW